MTTSTQLIVSFMLVGSMYSQTPAKHPKPKPSLGSTISCSSCGGTNLTSNGTTMGFNQRCDSRVSTSGWHQIETAPRDGKTVELMQTYGTAPTYGLYHFKDNEWMSVSDPTLGMTESNCLYWRENSTDEKKYVDPTGGKQNTVKYWCDSMHIKYDAKKDVCIP